MNIVVYIISGFLFIVGWFGSIYYSANKDLENAGVLRLYSIFMLFLAPAVLFTYVSIRTFLKRKRELAEIEHLKSSGKKILVPYEACEVVLVDLTENDELKYPTTIFDSLKEVKRKREFSNRKFSQIVFRYENKNEQFFFRSSPIMNNPESVELSMKIHGTGTVYLDVETRSYYFDIGPIGK